MGVQCCVAQISMKKYRNFVTNDNYSCSIYFKRIQTSKSKKKQLILATSREFSVWPKKLHDKGRTIIFLEGGMENIEIRFKVLKTCNGKLDCLIYEMLFIQKIRPCFNTQSRLHTRKTIYLNSFKFKFVTLHAYFTFYRLARYILICQFYSLIT